MRFPLILLHISFAATCAGLAARSSGAPWYDCATPSPAMIRLALWRPLRNLFPQFPELTLEPETPDSGNCGNPSPYLDSLRRTGLASGPGLPCVSAPGGSGDAFRADAEPVPDPRPS